MQVTLPAALFVPNSLLNQFRRGGGDMLTRRGWLRINEVVRKLRGAACAGHRKRISAFLANVYSNHKSAGILCRYGVQLIDAAYGIRRKERYRSC